MTESTHRPCCCGTLAQQQKRIARFNELIAAHSAATSGEGRRILHHAQQTKDRIEKWISAHKHTPVQAMRTDSAWQASTRNPIHVLRVRA